MYNNIAQLLSQAKQRGVPLHEIVLEDQTALTDASREEIYAHLAADWDVMKKSATRALAQPQDMHPPLIRGQAARQQRFAQSGATLCGAPINGMMAMALSASEVNAAMGRICAAPTAGACGILPAVLCCAAQRLDSSEQAVLDALLVAAGIGAVITKNATVSGAQGGCQAECGTAAAMAAAAAVYLANGTPEMCANAAAISLINCMGLICDPVAGLVQLPCSFRNASQSANALASADMALAGQSSVIPPDEVIEAMYAVGKSLPGALRETAQGGIAATRTGQKLAGGLAAEGNDALA
ncbi:MAG: L-serine ammonia-lyase, iron-sulfur-dependent, subunit alpha [Ruthenibacterium sp.]